MEKKIYLHLGLHKTATTSFQATCAKNRDVLLKQGFLYPLINCGDSAIAPFDNHSIPLFSLFTSEPENYPVNQRLGLINLNKIHQQYRLQFKTILNTDQDLIISAEDITSLETDEIKDLLTYLQKTGKKIKPFAAIRHPYNYHCSQLQQQIKDGQPMTLWHHCPQRDRIEKVDDIFKKDIQFIDFEASCNHLYGPVGYLMESMGIDLQNIEITGRNIGRCNANIRLQNLLNHKEPGLKDNQRNPHHIKIAPFAGKKFRLTDEELSRRSPHWDDPSRDVSLIEHLEHENMLIKEITGIKWDITKIERLQTHLDNSFPYPTYALILTIGRILQSMHHTSVKSLPIEKIHEMLTNSSSNLLQKLQPISKSHINCLIQPSLKNHSDTVDDELKKCGIPSKSVSALMSLAMIWIRRRRGEN